MSRQNKDDVQGDDRHPVEPDMPPRAVEYSFDSLHPVLDIRKITVDKKVHMAKVRLHQDSVREILERYIRDKYCLSLNHQVIVTLLDIERSDDAAAVIIEIDEEFMQKRGKRDAPKSPY